MEDRPPEVRVTRPARDRSVTPLEEVDIEAEAEDDFGIGRLELVYAVRGGAEKVVPMSVPSRATSVSGSQTLYLEDLDVQPGDFVSYYVRARDVPRGKRAERDAQRHLLPRGQAVRAGVLARAEPEHGRRRRATRTSTTWSPRRKRSSSPPGSSIAARKRPAARGPSDDIQAVAKAEAELKTRVEETSSSFRASTMRDPRRRPTPQGRGDSRRRRQRPRAGQTRPEEDAMTAAAQAMGEAVASLEKLKTGEALPPEMEALNHLLKAQADVKERQVTRQQAGSGGGANRADAGHVEPVRPRASAPAADQLRDADDDRAAGDNETSSTLDKIKELARRQDELNARQQALTRARR